MRTARIARRYRGGSLEIVPLGEIAIGDELYPSLNRVLGGADPTAPMSRAHAEIAYQIARLGRLTEDIGDRDPDASQIADLRGAPYQPHCRRQRPRLRRGRTAAAVRQIPPRDRAAVQPAHGTSTSRAARQQHTNRRLRGQLARAAGTYSLPGAVAAHPDGQRPAEVGADFGRLAW